MGGHEPIRDRSGLLGHYGSAYFLLTFKLPFFRFLPSLLSGDPLMLTLRFVQEIYDSDEVLVAGVTQSV
jgi:hypothetical protein